MSPKKHGQLALVKSPASSAGFHRLPEARDGIAGGIRPLPRGTHQPIPSRKTLTDRAVDRAKWTPDGKTKLFDGRGLYLFLTPAGAKVWRADYRIHGKRRTISYGDYEDVSLSEAREKHKAARKLVAAGQDPVDTRRAERLKARTQDTVKALADEWLSKRPLAPATRKKLRLMIRVHIEPALGRLPVASLTPAVVLEALRPLEDRAHTAHRVKQILGQMLRYAVATGRALRDITADLKGALSPAKAKNYAAPTTPAEVARLLRAIDSYEGSPVVSALLRLAPLVFVRPGELRKAEWQEFDLKAGLWRIPAAKMKMRADHLVPLSTQAVAILVEVQRVTGRGRFVFPSPRDVKRPLSDMTHGAALKALGFTTAQIVPHGFRAMARTLLDEQLRVQPDIIEVQLAHTVTGALGATYNRALYLDERTAMMQKWADYLDHLRGQA